MKPKRYGKREWTVLALAAIASTLLLRVDPAQGAVMAPIVGEIERISLDNPADVWSGGRIVVRGDNVVIPRNLLIDLPANRLTLQQLFAQAPPSCLANGETGLAKADRCNTRVRGGSAIIFANRTGGGDVIAGDVRISKAVESVTGTVTYVSYTDGYFRLNGIPGDNATGVMVRVNDPSGRHTIQQGLGCAPGNTENCSADARFGIDSSELHLRVRDGVPAVHPERGQRGERVNGCGGPVLPVDEPPGASVAGLDAVRARRPRGQPLGDGELRAGGGGAVPLRAHGEGVRRRDDAEPADAAGLHDLQRGGVGRAGVPGQPGRGAVPRCDDAARLPGGHLLGALRHRQRPPRDPPGDDREQPGERRRRLPRRTDRHLRYRAGRGLHEDDPGASSRARTSITGRRPRDLRLLLQPVRRCCRTSG